MMNCCQETGSVYSEPPQNCLGSDNTLNQHSQLSENLPRIDVKLDLPHSDGYIPTYWPGQSITGQLHMELPTAVTVNHLYVALFGNVQVHGDRPEQPVSNGLFDYRRDEQLINIGLRITKKKPTLHQQEQSAEPCLDSMEPGNEAWQTQYDVVDLCEPNEQRSTLSRNGLKQKKTSENCHLEKLIRKIAVVGNLSDQHHGVIPHSNKDSLRDEMDEDAFGLDANTYLVAFAIPIPATRKLPGTFDHSNYPITYRVVAVMNCLYQTETGKQMNAVVYHTIRIRLESVSETNSPSLQIPIQVSPTYQCIQNNSSFKNRICSYFLSSSSILTAWACKSLNHQEQCQGLDQISRAKPYYSSYLQSYLYLPKKAFRRSQNIPLKLVLTNYAVSHFRMSTVQISVELIRRINMTCSVNEEVESVVLQSCTALISCPQEQPGNSFFKTHNLHFDLSQIIKVPDDCVCTTPSKATREVFEINYILNVKLNVVGTSCKLDNSARQNRIGVSPAVEELYLPVSKQHVISPDQIQPTINEVDGFKQKCYTIQVKPIPIVIGNVD